MTDAERNRFFFGQLLGVEELNREQAYLLEKRWLHNRRVHGYGVVDGLTVEPAPDGGPAIVVQPGLALDRLGREIVVAEPCRVDVRAVGPEPSTVLLAYAEQETERRTIHEGYELRLVPGSATAGDAVALGAVSKPAGSPPLVDLTHRDLVSPTAVLEERIRLLDERVARLERSLSE